MEPPVITSCELKSKFLVLVIILTYINIKTIAADIMKRPAGDLHTLRTALSANITALDQFFLNLYEVLFLLCNVQCCTDRCQMFNLFLCLFRQRCKSFISPLQLLIFIEIFLGILSCAQCRVQRNRDHFIGIVIESFQRLGSLFCSITVGIEQFTINTILFSLCCIFQLFHL